VGVSIETWKILNRTLWRLDTTAEHFAVCRTGGSRWTPTKWFIFKQE